MDRGGLRAAHGAGGLQADGVTQDGIGTPGQVEVMGNGMISLRNLRATTGRLSWMNGRDLADPDLAIITDASPQGVGAILCYVNLAKGELVPWAAMEAAVRKEDADWLALEFGEGFGGLGRALGSEDVEDGPSRGPALGQVGLDGGVGHRAEAVQPLTHCELGGGRTGTQVGGSGRAAAHRPPPSRTIQCGGGLAL